MGRGENPQARLVADQSTLFFQMEEVAMVTRRESNRVQSLPIILPFASFLDIGYQALRKGSDFLSREMQRKLTRHEPACVPTYAMNIPVLVACVVPSRCSAYLRGHGSSPDREKPPEVGQP